MNITIKRYDTSYRILWDNAVNEVRQSVFLFNRDFIDYHKDRFADFSLMVFDHHHKVVALFPAHISQSKKKRIESHGGLTFGGLLLTIKATTHNVNFILSQIIAFYKESGFTELLYKTVPHIYHTYPSEEDLYALFLHQAQLSSRAVSSVIDLRYPCPFSTLRKRKVKKANRSYRYVEVSTLQGIAPFWRILKDVLKERHHTAPVHSLVELQYLFSKFKQHIRLFIAIPTIESNTSNLTLDSLPVAGCILFISKRVIHVQYIAATDQGCALGALDGLFNYLISKMPLEYPEIPYFDFGISTEGGGHYLNEGLIFQKEGFGGRAVCYDSYLIKIE